MKIRDIGNICIVDVCQNTISQSDVLNLVKILKEKPKIKRLGINMHGVRHVDCYFYTFVELWKEKRKNKISFFNTEIPVFLQFLVSGMDGFINIYLDKNDFFNDKRLIIKRRFKLLKSA